MDRKKNLIIIVSIVCLIILIVGVTAAIKLNNNSVTFQVKNDMLEIINGTWRTGDSEFDFILTVSGEVANLSMDGKDDNEPDNIVLVPDKGYFYFESDGDTKEDRYYIIKDNGKYLIESGNWVFKKVE